MSPSVPRSDELIEDHKVTEVVIHPERAAHPGADDAAHSELLHRPDICPVGDLRRRQLPMLAATRQERDALPVEVPDRDRRGRLPIRRVELDLRPTFERVSFPAHADDADLGFRHIRREPTPPPEPPLELRPVVTGAVYVDAVATPSDALVTAPSSSLAKFTGTAPHRRGS